MTSSPLSGDVQEVVIGALLGIAVALGAQYVLTWRNLRWTWALVPAAVGLFATAGLRIVESWSVGLAVGGVVTARWAFLLERRDREAGGDARRRARQAVGIRDALAARRAGRAPTVGAGRYLLGFDGRRRPVTLRFGGQSGRHGLLVGASGSGKSNALLWCVARHVEAGFGVVVVDMKGDQLLARRLEREAERWRHPFQRWTLDGGCRWNPLARGNRSELKDKLIGAEEFTERHYQAMYERYLVNVFRALEHRPEQRNLRTVIGLLDPAALAIELRELDDDQAAEEIGAYLARLTAEQARDLRGLADRLALLVEGGHGDYLTPADEADGEIDLIRAIGTGAVVLFSLNSSRYGQTARLIGNMVVQDIKTVCGAIEDTPGSDRPALVAVDEFAALDGDQVAGLFQRARSASISLVMATQELADLRRVDEGFDEQIVGNVEWLLAGRQNNPGSAELVAVIAGTEEVWVHTFQTEEGLGRPKSRFVRESGVGTKHRGREYYAPPDDIKRLPVGRMLLVEKNPHRVEVVDVMSADRYVPNNREAA
jgi:murein DD-endopeptidase MepM/ murein hydrolase activator NlpD